MAPVKEGAPLVDWSGPLEQVDGNREVLREIVDAYVTEIRENLELLPGLIAAGDTREVRRRAHTLKGAMRMFGAQAAQDLAAELEQRAADGVLEGASDLFERARAAALRVVPELVRFSETGALSV